MEQALCNTRRGAMSNKLFNKLCQHYTAFGYMAKRCDMLLLSIKLECEHDFIVLLSIKAKFSCFQSQLKFPARYI